MTSCCTSSRKTRFLSVNVPPGSKPRRAPRLLTSTRKGDRLTANQAALSAEVGWTRPGPAVRGFRNCGRVLDLSGSRRVLRVPRQFGSRLRSEAFRTWVSRLRSLPLLMLQTGPLEPRIATAGYTEQREGRRLPGIFGRHRSCPPYPTH